MVLVTHGTCGHRLKEPPKLLQLHIDQRELRGPRSSRFLCPQKNFINIFEEVTGLAILEASLRVKGNKLPMHLEKSISTSPVLPFAEERLSI